MISSWQTKRIKFCDTLIMGQSPDGASVNNEGNGVPFLQGNAEFGERHPTSKHATTEPGKLCSTGDVLLSVRAPVGAVNVADQIYAIGRGLCAIRPKLHDGNYLRYLLTIQSDVLNSIATGTTFTAVSTQQVGNIHVPLTSTDEQRRIAAYLDEQTAKIDRLMDMRRRQMALLKEQRAALIQQAVTRGLNPDTPMKDSGLPWLGEIPAHWEVKRLKYLCSLLRDGTHQPPKRVEVGYPLLSVRNIQKGVFARRDDDSMISEEDFITLNRSLVVKTGDLLMAIVGATLGKVAVVPKMEQFQIQRSLAVMRPRLEMVHKEFLCYLIECQAFQKCLWSNVGFSAQPGIYLSTLGDLGFPLPSLKEQTQILEFVQYECQRIDRLLSAYIHQLEVLTEYRAALIHECVTGQRSVPEAATP